MHRLAVGRPEVVPTPSSPPKMRDLDESSRSATPLELFFDLVFTAVLSQLAAALVTDPSLRHVGEVALLALPVVWTWSQYTLYANRFDSDDAVYRVTKAVGMLGVAAMGVALPQASAGRSGLFVAGFLIARLLLLALYVRAVRHEQQTRPAVRTYLAGFTVGGLLWAATLLLPAGVRPVAWALLVVAELAVPLRAWSRVHDQDGSVVNVSHLSERHGLFTILVLGSGWLAIVVGVDLAGLTADSLVVALALFGAATALWWLYFEYGEAEPLEERLLGLGYVAAHLVLFVGLATAGAVTESLVAHAGDPGVAAGPRTALACGIAAFVLSLALLRSLGGSTGSPASTARVAVAGGLVLLAVFGGPLPPPGFVGGVAALVLVLLAVEAVSGRPQVAQLEAVD